MSREEQIKSRYKNKNKYKNLSCPNCSSKNIIKRGLRYTQNRRKIQRYFCKDCNKRFIQNNGFYRMRNHKKKITLCLDLFFRGMSLRKIQEHLQAFYPHNSSHMTILRWVRKYSVMIGDYTDKLKINSGTEIMSDEMEYSVKGLLTADDRLQRVKQKFPNVETVLVGPKGRMDKTTCQRMHEKARRHNVTSFF